MTNMQMSTKVTDIAGTNNQIANLGSIIGVFETENSPDQWFTADFDKGNIRVDKVELWTRKDNGGDESNNLQIQIDDNVCGNTGNAKSSSDTFEMITVICETYEDVSTAKGSRIKITSTANKKVTFQKIKVTGYECKKMHRPITVPSAEKCSGT